MMTRAQTAGIILLATLPLLACDGQWTAPLGDTISGAQHAHGLELSLRIDPAGTPSSGNLTATFTVTNRRDSSATLTSGCTALARGTVYRSGDEEPQDFIGTGDVCFTALSTYRLDVGESFEQVWNATAANRVYLGDFQWEIVPAPEGDYVFRVSPDVIWIDGGSARLPELHASLRVN